MRAAAVRKLTPDILRHGDPLNGIQGFETIGFTESPVWIDGFQFTPYTLPISAVESYFTLHNQEVPTRYHICPNGTFVLSHSDPL